MLFLVSTVSGCVSISTFVSLVAVPLRITSSEVAINICAITAGIKKHKSIIKKKKKKHDEIVLFGKDKLNTIEVLISKALIDSYIRHNEFISVNNMLREYYEMKEERKNPGNQWEYLILNLSHYILLSCIAKLSEYRIGIKFDKDPLAESLRNS